MKTIRVVKDQSSVSQFVQSVIKADARPPGSPWVTSRVFATFWLCGVDRPDFDETASDWDALDPFERMAIDGHAERWIRHWDVDKGSDVPSGPMKLKNTGFNVRSASPTCPFLGSNPRFCVRHAGSRLRKASAQRGRERVVSSDGITRAWKWRIVALKDVIFVEDGSLQRARRMG